MSTPKNLPEINLETSGNASGVIRLKPQQFIHVLDTNTGVTRLEVGPQIITFETMTD